MGHSLPLALPHQQDDQDFGILCPWLYPLESQSLSLWLPLQLTLRLTLGCCMAATMEATLEVIMADTIPTMAVIWLAARGERLLLSLLLTLKLTLGCTTTATILPTTMEDIMEDTTPMLLENKKVSHYVRRDAMTQ